MTLHKARLDHYKTTSNQPLIKWCFDSDTLFERLNAYLLRLHDIQKIMVAANDFLKLEKIEIGGIKGRHLSERIRAVLNEFHSLYGICITNQSNLLEPSNRQFKVLKKNFRRRITILERKLSQIFAETFLNCNSIESSVKVIEMFGGLLRRPIIWEQVATQIEALMESIRNEISDIHSLLEDNQRIRVNG